MGLFQKAVETYEANESIVGVYREGKETLAPIGHVLKNADVEITINLEGEFISARVVGKEEPKVLIPVTESSGGRTGTKAFMNPHPLCDTVKYFMDNNCYYINQLKGWENSGFYHPFLTAIRKYVERGSMQADLYKVFSSSEPDSFICWRIEGDENEEAASWKNTKLQRSYIGYYLNKISNREKDFCMIEGGISPFALQHPKGIVSINGNAKLISANDTNGFTYRGRFANDQQAVTVGYVASQKAHNALQWLVSDQGVREYVGNRVYLCWNPKGKKLPQPSRSLRSYEEAPVFVPTTYKDDLKKNIMGIKNNERFLDTDQVVLAAFDAATPGRLATVYYSEINANAFFRRMEQWESRCCWYYGKFGLRSPALYQIVNCAFGIQRGNNLETDDKILRHHLQRLLNCKVGGGGFPLDIVQLLAKRASNPQSFNERNWRTIVRTACATIQKHRYDMKQGGDEMSWELNQRDRSFQFGRLLATMERAEQDYYSKTMEIRQTNAIKLLSEFCQRPWFVFERVNRQLHQAYLGRISTWQAIRYERLIGEICENLREYPEADLNKPLKNTYLMGYELQRNAFYTKNSDNEKEE